MCDPLTAIGAGLSIAGGVANGLQQQAYAEAVNRENNKAYQMSKLAREQELARQQAFEQQAVNTWQQNLDKFSKENTVQKQDASAQQFVQKFDAAAAKQNTDGQYLSGQKFASDEIKQAIADRGAAAAAEARQRATALAQLAAYGSVGAGQQIDLSDTNNSLTTLNGIRRGSLQVSNQEQNIQPAKVTQGFALGDILGGAGQLAMGVGQPKTIKTGSGKGWNPSTWTPSLGGLY